MLYWLFYFFSPINFSPLHFIIGYWRHAETTWHIHFIISCPMDDYSYWHCHAAPLIIGYHGLPPCNPGSCVSVCAFWHRGSLADEEYIGIQRVCMWKCVGVWVPKMHLIHCRVNDVGDQRDPDCQSHFGQTAPLSATSPSQRLKGEDKPNKSPCNGTATFFWVSFITCTDIVLIPKIWGFFSCI